MKGNRLGLIIVELLLNCKLLELTPQKDVFFIIGDWNTKAGSQETPGVTGKYWPWNTE